MIRTMTQGTALVVALQVEGLEVEVLPQVYLVNIDLLHEILWLAR